MYVKYLALMRHLGPQAGSHHHHHYHLTIIIVWIILFNPQNIGKYLLFSTDVEAGS